MFQNVNELPQLQEMIDGGYVYTNRHPTAPLVIYNYTGKAQYGSVWNDATLACRGLICDLDGNVKYRPFSKFFNLEQMQALPNEPFEIFEKLDGSLGILYWHGDAPFVATRGSFTSEQATWATQWLLANLPDTMLCTKYTYLFEIIYPENKIVVNYGDRRELVLLAVIETETGNELPIDCWGFKTAKRFDDVTDVESLKKLTISNFEGFVVKYASGVRVKVKLDEYVRLHKLVCGINEKFILESLMNNDDIYLILKDVPDELYNWAMTVIDDLSKKYHEIEQDIRWHFANVVAETRRDYAIAFQKTPYTSALFAMLDGKDYSKIIWKQIAATI